MNTEEKLREARRRGVRRFAKLRKAANLDPRLRFVRQIAEAMETDSISMVLMFLLSRNEAFGKKTALELLQAGEVERVMTEARTFLRHGT